MDEKTKLRNQLFESYFEKEEGLELQEMMNRISFIQDIWKDLHQILEKNLRYFDAWSRIDDIKEITNREKRYLIIKFHIYYYLIIDLENNQLVSKSEVQRDFSEKFFVENFHERKNPIEDSLNMYSFENKYVGNIQDLVEFYQRNKDIFNLPNRFIYQIKINDARTYLSIDLANGRVQLGFDTPDQFLYEHLFMESDLTPSGLQDATSRIGVDKMMEMFERVKSIKIPFNRIPVEFFQQGILPEPPSSKIPYQRKLRKKSN